MEKLEIEKSKEERIRKRWDSMMREEKEKVLEQINQKIEYQFDEKFWSTMPFEKLPFMLKNLIKARLKVNKNLDKWLDKG
ncbi:MAG: hypothetical protein QXQ82_00015 [Candidatus Pacearchaeota archaeon]